MSLTEFCFALIVSLFMGKKQHATLSETFEDKFPKLFNFEACGLILVDTTNGSLYKIIKNFTTEKEISEKPESVMDNAGSNKPIILRMPGDRGITGNAMTFKEIQVAHEGDQSIKFAAEADNSLGLPIVRNIMIGPCYDTQGKIRGIIQMFNKMGSDPISLLD